MQKLKTFELFFGCAIGKTLLTETDHLSEKLQALEAQTLTATTMIKKRNDERFDNFWDCVIQIQMQLSINGPWPSRKIYIYIYNYPCLI